MKNKLKENEYQAIIAEHVDKIADAINSDKRLDVGNYRLVAFSEAAIAMAETAMLNLNHYQKEQVTKESIIKAHGLREHFVKALIDRFMKSVQAETINKNEVN